MTMNTVKKTDAEYCFYAVYGLKNVTFARMPFKDVPLRVFRPAITKLAARHGLLQKDVSFECLVGDDGNRGIDYEIFDSAFNGSGKLKKADLLDWDAASLNFVLHRPRPFTRQMELAERAAVYLDALPADHPSRLTPSHVEWHVQDFVELSHFGTKEEWLDYYQVESKKHEQAGTLAEFRSRAHNKFEPIIVFVENKVIHLLHGKDRVAGGFKDGDDGAKAILGAPCPENQHTVQQVKTGEISMKSVQTPWTKIGITAHDVVAQVGGPSPFKTDFTVPKGTAVHFIGHWVVADLGWFAEKVGAGLIAAMPSIGADKTSLAAGRGSIEYHDADHYGITIKEGDVTDVKDVKDANVEQPRRFRP